MSEERTLNERLAILMGWERVDEPYCQWRIAPHGTPAVDADIPDFEHSVDALKPVEEKLREAGWVSEMRSANEALIARYPTQGLVVGFEAMWWSPENHGGCDASYTAPTEPEARAKAAEAALIALSVDTERNK